MNGRELITRKFRQLLAAMVFAAGTILAGLYLESIPLMVTGVGLAWGVSRYGYRTICCPYCNRSLYKHLFAEAAIMASWVSWSKKGQQACPSCKISFSQPI